MCIALDAVIRMKLQIDFRYDEQCFFYSLCVRNDPPTLFHCFVDILSPQSKDEGIP